MSLGMSTKTGHLSEPNVTKLIGFFVIVFWVRTVFIMSMIGSIVMSAKTMSRYVATSKSLGELSVSSVSVLGVVETGNTVFVDIALGLFTFHVLLDLQWIISVVEDTISAVDDEFAVPWTETFVTHDHAHDVTISGLSTDKSTTFNFVTRWFQFA
jgi:hypothetical protein